jgi:signal transduction histidine kinase
VKLRTKVTLAVVGVTSIFSLLLGSLILNVSYDAGVAELTKNIKAFETQVMSSKQDPISIALLLGESRDFNIQYVESDGSITKLIESYEPNDVTQQVTHSIKLGSGEKLTISASTVNELRAKDTAFLFTLLLSLLSGLISGLLSLLILRKDIRVISSLTDEAGLVAAGSMEEISTKSGSLEIRALSEALHEMTRQLQSSRIQMKTFIGDASHELKTPLTVIRGYLDLLSRNDEMSPAKRKVAIERSLSESLRMQRLVTDLLQLAELEEAPKIEMAPFNLGELIAESVYDLQSQQSRRKVDLFLEPEANFVGSKELMSQVLANAFQNIVRYTKESDRVRVTLQTFDDALYLLIEDSGPGISSLQSGKVINSFNRFDESRSRSAGGSGLGLSIMAKIMDLHGGKMVLSRSELGGLQVSLSFPQKRVS